MIEAYSEQLITIDELRTRMPHLRARETSLRSQIEALHAQAADQDAYLKLADDLDGFLAQLRGSAATASISERQRCCGCWSKTSSSDPRRSPSATASRSGNDLQRRRPPDTPTRGDMRRVIHVLGYHTALRGPLICGCESLAFLEHARLQPAADHSLSGKGSELGEEVVVVDLVECRGQVCV